MPASKSTSSLRSTFEKGRSSEELVCQKLIQEGFLILHRNWRTPYGEVDLVAVTAEELWILEIKSQASRFLGRKSPLGFSQKQRLKRAALWIWLRERRNYKRFRCRLVIVTECGMKWITLPLLYDQA